MVAKTLYNTAIRVLPLPLSLRLQHLRYTRRLPNLRSPKTFNEKVNWRKLNDPNPLFEVLADKVSVKSYVQERLGPGWVIPTLWHGAALPPRGRRNWPLPFVLKANHASGWNDFVRTPEDMDWARIEAEVKTWLRTPWHPHNGEGWYNRFERQVLVEPLVGELGSVPWDYKFFVFSGRVAYVQVDTDRFTGHKRCFYDREWRKQPFSLHYPFEPRDIPRPGHLEKMVIAAEELGRDLDFVRIDFYDLEDGPLFGEITFAPDAGHGRFNPASWDGRLGALWTLPVT